MVKVSIIIPIYNAEKYLKACLDSVIRQDLEDIEIICINDGSLDNSEEILNEYVKKDERIICINQNNQGSAIARNKGLEIAKGDYIGFIDSDDIFIEKDCLNKLYTHAHKNNADMISANLKFLDKTRNLIENKHYAKGTFYYFDKNCEISPDEYGIPFYFYKNLYKNEFIKKYNITFPDLKRGQDPIFLSKVLAKLDKIHGIAIDFYGYMVPGDFSKLNSYQKKYDYIKQYKECFDILNQSELFKTSDKYMNNLMLYLENTVDSEVFDIVCDVFGDELNNYPQYHAFKARNIINRLIEKSRENYYNKSKQEIDKLTVTDKDLNSQIKILLKSESYKEFKINLFKYKLNKTDEDIKKLKKENKKLKERKNPSKLNIFNKLRGR